MTHTRNGVNDPSLRKGVSLSKSHRLDPCDLMFSFEEWLGFMDFEASRVVWIHFVE